MIELTTQQLQALENTQASPPQMVNPRTREKFVLLRVEEYRRLLAADEYDDSTWTKQELQTLAWEAGKSAGWEEMDEYDDLPEKPSIKRSERERKPASSSYESKIGPRRVRTADRFRAPE